MKILFFVESLRSGGKERRLVELIKGLSKHNDVDMEIVLMKDEIHYNDVIETGIKIHYVIRKNLKKDPRVFFKFYKIAKTIKPDIIHVWGNMVAIYAIPAKTFLKIPMVNNQITDAPESVGKSLIDHNLTFRFSDKIVANSKAGLKAYNTPLKKSKVIYNGFDFNRLNKLKDRALVTKQFDISTKYVVGMVASFSYKKDYNSYIKAANIVLEKCSNTTFICVGSGSFDEYEQMIKPENKNRILFLGKQQQVESIMNICDIGVLATFTEGISNSILEFMALGKPVVVTGQGGCSELVSHKQNGFLLEAGNIQGLADKVLYLLDNEKERVHFGKISIKIVNEKFSISKMVDEFRTVYGNILN